MTENNEGRPWCSAQPLEFLTVNDKGGLLAEPPIPLAAYIIIQNWYETKIIEYGHEKCARVDQMRQPIPGFGGKKAIICKDKDAANRMMNFLTKMFYYQEPELLK